MRSVHVVGFHGSEIQTPFLDSLARGAHSVHLDGYYGQSICTPARASMLTGRYASHTGLQHSYWTQGAKGGLPLKFKSMGDHFKEQGFATHMVGKWHLGFETWAYTPIGRGFDTYFGYVQKEGVRRGVGGAPGGRGEGRQDRLTHDSFTLKT